MRRADGNVGTVWRPLALHVIIVAPAAQKTWAQLVALQGLVARDCWGACGPAVQM